MRARAVQPSFGFAGDRVLLAGGAHPAHAHGDLELNLLASGAVRYFLAGRFLDLPRGRWLAYWGALPHHIVSADPRSEFLWITVPLARLIDWGLGGTFHRLLIDGEMPAEPRAWPDAAERGRDWLAALRSRDPWSRRIAELEIEATLRRLALTRAPLRPEPTARARGGMVEAIGAWLGARYREQVRVADCARAVGLHPRYAMPLFRRACGMTIGQYLLRLRLAHAQHQLLTTDRDVLAIALDSGFGSQSRFYLQFKRAFGMPPAAYRRSGGR